MYPFNAIVETAYCKLFEVELKPGLKIRLCVGQYTLAVRDPDLLYKPELDDGKRFFLVRVEHEDVVRPVDCNPDSRQVLIRSFEVIEELKPADFDLAMGKISPFSAHEALDRARVMADMFTSFVHDHPFIQRNETLNEEASNLVDSLECFYQSVGQYQ